MLSFHRFAGLVEREESFKKVEKVTPRTLRQNVDKFKGKGNLNCIITLLPMAPNLGVEDFFFPLK